MASSKIDANNPQASTQESLLTRETDHLQGPWESILRMKEFKLNPIIIHHIQKHATDPLQFLNDPPPQKSDMYKPPQIGGNNVHGQAAEAIHGPILA